jgi:molecular chaperone HscB
VAAVTPSRSADLAGRVDRTNSGGASDPFDLFQVEPCFELDLEELGQRHRELSRALHPDRYVGRSAGERRQALGVLKDPLRRAEALLVRLGYPMVEGSQPPAEPEFLMEMMERREALRELARQGDMAGVEALSRESLAARGELLEELAAGFRKALSGEEDGAPESLIGRMGKLRYYRRFLDEVDAVLIG